MFQFANPEYLYFLIATPLLLLLYIGHRLQRRRRLRRLGDSDLLRRLMPDASPLRHHWKFALALIAYSIVVVMMARPQMGLKFETTEQKGIEIIVALDVSNSMMANDIAPSRLDKAKLLVSNIADKLTNDKIGLVVFAGDAFIQMPITSDFVSAKMFLDAISPNMIGVQGTNIGEALRVASNSFTNQENIQRAIILITDTEDHEGAAEEMAREVAKSGIRIYILGIGTERGSTIPMDNDVLKDREGSPVITRLNIEAGKAIADAGRGAFIHVDNTSIAQDHLYLELNKLQKTHLGTSSFSEYDEQFMYPGWIALILLIIEICIQEKKNPFFNRFKIFRDK